MQTSIDTFNFKSMPLDLAGIAFDIADGSLSEIKELFFVEGKYAPIIRWCSFSQYDWPKPQQIVCDYWRSHDTIEAFNLSDFDTNEMLSAIKPYIAVLSKDKNDYTYDFIGEGYAKFHNLTTQNPASLLSILNHTQGAIDLLNYTIMAATAIRDQGAICLYQGGNDLNPELWNKIILPLKSTTSDAQKFIICALKSP
jgi:hypothetical protein